MGIQSTMSMARYFLLLFFLSVGFFLTPTQYAHAALVSPVPLTRVMPTNQDSLTFGKPGNYQVPHFFFSYTQSYERCECGGGVDNGGSYTIQMCLNKLGFTVAEYGHGSPGMETNCIGAKTVDALAHFQNYFGFEEAGINHYGERTAIAGPITQTIMNYTCLGLEGDQEDGLAKSFTGKIETSISQPIFRRGSRSRAASSNNSVSVNTDTARFTFTKTGEFSDTNNDDAAQAGEFIDYTFTIENTGNQDLSGLQLIDNAITTSITCNDGENNTASPRSLGVLAEDGIIECMARYTIEPSDLVGGVVENSATVISPDAQDRTSNWDETLTLAQPSFTFTKTGEFSDTNNDDAAQAGEFIDYTFTIENTGNQDLSGLQLIDNAITTSITCNDGENNTASPRSLGVLAEDGIIECMARYTIEPSDLVGGVVENSATVISPDAQDRTSNWDETLTLAQPSFTFTKTGEFSDTNNDDAAQAGEFIDYTFTIENTGNVALAQLEIDDPLLAQTLIVCDDINITNGFSPLTFTNPIDADSTVQCEASYAIEPNDLLSTSLMNTATASAEGVDPITQQWEVVLPVDLVCNPQQLTQQFDIAYGDLTANNDRTFDLYPALNGQAEGTIVFFHGGGGEGREPGRAQDTLTADLIYLNQWFNIADVNYSYTMDAVNEPIPANRYPQSILDAKAAVNYIATNYDPRVYVMGVSFGGYLSNILATTQTSGPFGNAEMQAAASLYGVSDWSRSAGFYEPGASNPIDYDACQGFPNAPGPDCTILNNAAQTPDAFTWNFFGDTPVNVPAIAAQANPLNYVDANTAPLFLAHGTSDRVVPYNHSVWLADELNTAGVVNQFESRNVGHGSLQNDLSIRDGVRDFFRDQAPSCP